MFATRRVLSAPVLSAGLKAQTRCFSAIHSTTAARADAPAATLVEEEKNASAPATPVASGGIIDRFTTTGEVIVSKIFPAGFGWQTASVVADSNFGFASNSLEFALTTGVGDAIGVFLGHSLYYGVKKAVYDPNISLNKEAQTGFLLASAAFCSGTAWQPIVDVLQGANLSFLSVFAGTWVGCGTAFYVGLRAGRSILPAFLSEIEEPTFENSKTDASLSVSIGGATAFFVGTDAAYLPQQNFLIDIVGIQDGTPDLTGAAIAGSSTALGFATSQTILNTVYPAGKCWND